MGVIKTHALKIKPNYFKDVVRGDLTFQVRRNDRNFRVGDILQLEEFDHRGYTGRYINAEVTYVLNDVEYCKKDYVLIGFKIRLDRGAVIL